MSAAADAIPVSRVRYLVDLAERVGAPASVHAHLRAILTDPTYGEPGTSAKAYEVERELEARFWNNVAAHRSLSDFSSNAPRAASPGALGTLELAATTAPTVRDALSVLAELSDLAYGAQVLSVVHRKDGGVAVFYESPLPREQLASQLATEAVLSSVLEIVRRGVGDPLVGASALHLRGHAIAGTVAFARAARCEVRLGAASDRVDIAPDVAAMPLVTSAPSVHAVAQRLARLERDALFRDRMGPRVRAALRELVTVARDGDVELLSVAAAARLRVPVRTLQARLTAEHTNFRSLVDDARRVAVDRLLAEGKGPKEVQAALGYGDSASLRRACRRWWGAGPTSRQRALR